MPPLIRPGRTPLPGQPGTGFKPSPWNVQRRYVAPEWRWAWQSLDTLHPTWEGGGLPRDIAGTADGEPGAQNNPVWVTDPFGLSLSFDETDEYYTVSDQPTLTLPDGDWTIVFYVSIPDNSGSAFQYFYSWGGFSAQSSINLYTEESGNTGDPDTLKANIEDGSGNEQSLTSDPIAPFSDYKLIAYRKQGSGATSIQIFDGATDITASTDHAGDIGAIDRSDALNIGRRSDGNADRYFGGKVAWWGKWSRSLPQEQLGQLHRDPFGPFRPYQTIQVAPASTGTTVTVGLASETDAGTLTGAAKTQSVGLSSETDVGLASTADKAYGAGLAAETDAGLTSTAEKAYAAGLASETDVGLTAGSSKVLSVGLAGETDAGLAAVAEKLYDLGLASETDTGLSATAAKLLLAGLATETDAGLAASSSTEIIVSVGLAAETDSALAAGATKLLLVGLAAETDAGLTPGALKAYSLGLAGETDTALTPGAAKVLSAGLAAETDAGLSATAAKMVAAGLASESDAALTATALRAVTVGLAAETDVGLAATVGAAALDLDPPFTLSVTDPGRSLEATDDGRTLSDEGANRTLERD